MDPRELFTVALAIIPAISYWVALKFMKVSLQTLKAGYFSGCIVMLAGIWWMMRVSITESISEIGCPVAIIFAGFVAAAASLGKSRSMKASSEKSRKETK